MRIDLRIGGYGIRLDEPEGQACWSWPLYPFDSFVAPPDDLPDINLTVRIVQQLPEIPQGALLFDSCHGFWKLHEAGYGCVLECADPKTLAPRSRTVLSRDFSRGEVWICGRPARQKRQLVWKPMYVINPIAEVCLVTKLAREGGLLLHSAGVLAEHGAWVFTGPSGAGKSTLSDFFAAQGASVLSDERIIIRKVAGEFTVFGTPWPGTGRLAKNQHGPLTALYCIRHGEGAHALRKISPRDFSLFVLRQCFLPHWDREAMNRTLAFLGELIEQTGCFELAFVKKPDIVDYLDKQSCRRSLVPS